MMMKMMITVETSRGALMKRVHSRWSGCSQSSLQTIDRLLANQLCPSGCWNKLVAALRPCYTTFSAGGFPAPSGLVFDTLEVLCIQRPDGQYCSSSLTGLTGLIDTVQLQAQCGNLTQLSVGQLLNICNHPCVTTARSYIDTVGCCMGSVLALGQELLPVPAVLQENSVCGLSIPKACPVAASASSAGSKSGMVAVGVIGAVLGVFFAALLVKRFVLGRTGWDQVPGISVFRACRGCASPTPKKQFIKLDDVAGDGEDIF
jgi:hypothetical protein